MACGSFVAFAQWGFGGDALGLPPAVRYAAVCLFSLGGGMVPATLFMLAVRAAPSSATVSTTVGIDAAGVFVRAVHCATGGRMAAHAVGGWQWTWVATVACSLIGMLAADRG